MDHDDAPVGRILTRREAIARLGGAAAFLAAGRSAAGPTTRPRDPIVASPAMTQGPFFIDLPEPPAERADLVGDADRPAVVEAAPLALTIAVYRLDAGGHAPMPGARVDLWHCDAHGVYSGGGETWLRGHADTDADGLAAFRTVVPGWYPGRAPHVHFKVRPPADGGGEPREFGSQLYFLPDEIARVYAEPPYAARGPADTPNARDFIYNLPLADGTPAGDRLLLDLDPADGGGHATALPVLLTDAALRGGRDRRRRR